MYINSSTHQVKVGDWCNSPEFLSLAPIHDSLQNQGDALGNVLIKQLDELLSVPLARLIVHPAFPVGLVAQVLWVYEDHSTPRDCGRTGILQVTHLCVHSNCDTSKSYCLLCMCSIHQELMSQAAQSGGS